MLPLTPRRQIFIHRSAFILAWWPHGESHPGFRLERPVSSLLDHRAEKVSGGATGNCTRNATVQKSNDPLSPSPRIRISHFLNATRLCSWLRRKELNLQLPLNRQARYHFATSHCGTCATSIRHLNFFWSRSQESNLPVLFTKENRDPALCGVYSDTLSSRWRLCRAREPLAGVEPA